MSTILPNNLTLEQFAQIVLFADKHFYLRADFTILIVDRGIGNIVRVPEKVTPSTVFRIEGELARPVGYEEIETYPVEARNIFVTFMGYGPRNRILVLQF